MRGAVDVVEISGDDRDNRKLCPRVKTAPLTCEATLPGLREFKLEAVRLRELRK